MYRLADLWLIVPQENFWVLPYACWHLFEQYIPIVFRLVATTPQFLQVKVLTVGIASSPFLGSPLPKYDVVYNTKLS